MCSLTNYDLLDMADQAFWYQTTTSLGRPEVLYNCFGAYNAEESELGALVHDAIQCLDRVALIAAFQDKCLAAAENILEEAVCAH